MQPITIDSLIERYETLLFDAYGVLVNSSAALPGVAELVEYLNRIDKPFFILSNDASKLPETMIRKYQSFGFKVDPRQIITSGMLLDDYFEEHQLKGSACVVLGTPDSFRYVQHAGGEIVSIDQDFEVAVIADEYGYDFVDSVDKVISGIFRKFDHRETVRLVLPNPDLIYPKNEDEFGIAAGSIAMMIEAAIKLRYPDRTGSIFDRLGKPYPAIFKKALLLSGTKNMVMIGDQIETDIRGAKDFGLDSALVGTGIVPDIAKNLKHLQPDYVLHSVKLPDKLR